MRVYFISKIHRVEMVVNEDLFPCSALAEDLFEGTGPAEGVHVQDYQEVASEDGPFGSGGVRFGVYEGFSVREEAQCLGKGVGDDQRGIQSSYFG